MKHKQKTKLIAWLTCLALLVAVTAAGFYSTSAHAAKNSKAKENKIADDLRDKKNRRHSGEKATVILQLSGAPSPQLNAFLNQNGVHLRQAFQNLPISVVDLPLDVLDNLEIFDEVSYISLDSELKAMGHVTSTTGADDARAQTSTLTGTGIGIAILDSGIYTSHKAFLNSAGASRVTYSKDFTGENRTDDPYGHGTHVASLAAGVATAGSGSVWGGIAPNANLINLRVLNSDGAGSVSQVLSAIDWVLSNRTSFNIKVVNMSLGMPAISSYKNDPVCVATRRLVDAGVVVVAAAGNDGKDSTDQKVYGTIHSPGNEPSAITVGASNSLGSDGRGDDVVTTYSSRGPTRSYWTDLTGLKHYDNMIKPDLVAPGNKLIAAEAVNNLIVSTYPELDTGAGPGKNNLKYMYLSGTSMSAPLTAGAAALMLQANPKLTPNMVKMILMYTAQQLPNSTCSNRAPAS